MHEPEADARHRVRRSVRCWVLERRERAHGKLTIEILGSVHRVVYKIEGYNGEYIRYRHHYHPLHPADEFRSLIEKADGDKLHVFSNEFHVSTGLKNLDEVLAAEFIYDDEPRFYAP